MFVHTNSFEFVRYALPLVVVTDMDVMASSTLSHNMEYVIAQAMSYLVAGSQHIQCLSGIEQAHVVFIANELEHKRQITDLEKET